MLNEFVKRLGAHKANRRTADRVRKRFPVAWLRGGEPVPGQGAWRSARRACCSRPKSAPGREVDVTMELGGRRVRARLRSCGRAT